MSTKLKFGQRSIPLPESKPVRLALGFLLTGLGFLGFLPVLGFWMVPLGLLVLSVDLPAVRRWRRRIEVKWGRWRAERRARQAAEPSLMSATEARQTQTRQGHLPR